MKKNQKLFGTTGIVFILAIVILLVFAGWYAWQQLNKKSIEAINSFEACAAAGNPIMESYPERCVANGKSFTNPEQTAPEPPKT